MSKMLNLSEDKVVYGPTDSDGKSMGMRKCWGLRIDHFAP